MQRKLAIGVLLALSLVTSGCVQAVTGDTVTFSASPATVADGTLSETGYALTQQDTVQVNRTVEVPVVGQRDVRITNHVRVYAPPGVTNDSAEAESTPAVLFVVSTPQAKVAGQGTNPLGRVPLEELVTRVASEGGFENMEKVGARDIDTLGASTTVEKYQTTAQRDGRSVETFVYVTRVPHGDDYVISVAVLPQQFADQESTVYELLRNLEHEE